MTFIAGPNAWLKRKLHLRPQHRGVHLVTEEILAGLPELSQFQVMVTMRIPQLELSAHCSADTINNIGKQFLYFMNNNCKGGDKYE